jgi:diguanylate cyclase (GGDEF)-like protein
VILRGSDVNGTIVLAEELRVLVESESPAWAAPVTISIGVAAPPPPEHASTPADLVVAADEALYEAKHAGRNCVCVAAVDPGRRPALGNAKPVAM